MTVVRKGSRWSTRALREGFSPGGRRSGGLGVSASLHSPLRQLEVQGRELITSSAPEVASAVLLGTASLKVSESGVSAPQLPLDPKVP